MKRPLDAIASNLRDARTFGASFLLRHLPFARRDGRYRWTMPGIGPVSIRPGTTDVEVFRQIFRAREYDLSGMRQYSAILTRYEQLLSQDKRPVIIDAGANVGAASLWFARAFPLATVIAVEPEPANAACCRANCAGHDRIVVREAAIGSRPGRITLDNPARKAWSVRSRRSEAEEGVSVVTIPELVADVADGALFIAKIDIEGFESDLFAANLDWIDAVKVMLVEIHDWMLPGQGSSLALQRAMGERGFEILISGENLIYINPMAE